MSLEQLNVALLVGAVVLLIATAAIRVSARVGLPSLLLYLAIGAILGQTGLIAFNDLEIAQDVGVVALVIILAEGGLTTRWSAVRGQMAPALSLATVGVAISVSVVALGARFILDLPWQLAVLAGAVLASTDAAAIFSTLRRVPLKPKLAGTLEAESGMNDAPVVILILILIDPTGHATVLEAAGALAYELALGALIGIAAGFGGAYVLRRAALPASGLYPLGVMTMAIFAYAGAASIHASGFLAVYLAGLVLGNSDLPHHGVTRGFVESVAWLAQIGMFVLLGLLVFPMDDLVGTLVPAFVIGGILTFIARPLAVVTAVAPFRFTWREQALLSWAGLRGAVPIIFALLPAVAGVTGGRRLLDVVFVIVVLYTIVQSPTLPWVARRLGVAGLTGARDLTVEAAPLDRVGADLLQVQVPPTSRLHGVEVAELRLPPGALVALVVRGDQTVVPSSTFALRAGDEVLFVVPRERRDAVVARLQAVSEHGRLARWLGSQPEPR